MATNPFFTLHADNPREGPGDRESLDWVFGEIDVPKNARICDAGCGPGADIGGLLEHAPMGHIDAVDAHEPFLRQAHILHGADDRVDLIIGNFAEITGPYDLIWSAGAIYFLGVTVALKQWEKALKPGGYVAFSQVYWKTDKPSKASKALWEDYGHMPYEAEVYDQVRQAGYRILAARELPAAAWEAYYTPIEARIRALMPAADAELRKVLEAEQIEIDTWRENQRDFGYLQVVTQPE